MNNLKEIFRTEAEDEKWHLISKSMTYDEAAKLWQTLVKNQDSESKVKELEEQLESLEIKKEYHENNESILRSSVDLMQRRYEKQQKIIDKINTLTNNNHALSKNCDCMKCKLQKLITELDKKKD